VPLFGPGLEPEPPYGALVEEAHLSVEALSRAFSRRAGAWLDLGPATDARPRFFDIARDAHPGTRWHVAACLAPLLLVLLVPLGDERRRDARARGVPIVVRLAEHAALGVACAFLLAGTVQRVPFATGVPVTREPAALAGFAFGLAIGWARSQRTGAAGALVPAAAAPLAAGVLVGAGEAWVAAAAGSPWARQLVAALVGAGLGTASAAAISFAAGRLASERPAAVGWAWIAFGVAAAGGSGLAAWLAHARGWPFVGGCIVAAHVAPLALAAWSHAARRRIVRGNG
jgi:hypothetical protein